MKITKARIIKAVKDATGLDVEIFKTKGQYYWGGEATTYFSDTCMGYTTLNHPNLTINNFISDFKEKLNETT